MPDPTYFNSQNGPTRVNVGTSAGSLVAANTVRRRLIIQNTGTTTLYLNYGTGNPTGTVYTIALKAGTAADDGTGGLLVDDNYTGSVQGLSSGTGGEAVVTELM